MSHIRQFEHLKITLEAIKSATNNFADGNYVGRGGFGKVYKGKIVHSEGQSMVAIKRLDREFGQGNREFWKEITMLSLYKHENLVHLLGFCDESDEKILVYEFVSNKGLDFHLNNNDLTWTQRLKICIEMARGLAYLHNSGTELRVIHRDIKSSNILLDENWNAKISDFGLAKLAPASNYTFVYTSVVGTPGYVDPLYKETGLLTKESDVYSLGVVLFEVLCGRLCNKGDQPLTKLARQYYKLNKVDTIVFCNIRDEMNPNSLLAFTKLAYGCSNREREERPSITEVVSTLETALRYQAIVSPSSGWMATANSSMPHASVAAGPPGLVQPPVAAAVLKDPQTPSSDPGLEYEAGPSDEEFFSASSYPPNAYSSNDLPKTAVRLLKQGSNVMSMDFHPQRQTTLLVGTNVGEIRIWEVGIQERMVHKPFKVWDISACSMPFRQLWQKMQQYLLNGAHGEQMDQYLVFPFPSTLLRYMHTTHQGS
ncbi:probable serine/threonine-protein kinase PBL22 isoform X1 [Lactuca sativa]|uniref:probable serine/threonine-protein kinase PBL22 isoform X1 n=1 Tax=Lactuca sativa TaxID=4236 RepID=UPI000CD890B3|nr:probable serine/threonine-protein kinase PBL22 isoform X1 [Lactuca sativa]